MSFLTAGFAAEIERNLFERESVIGTLRVQRIGGRQFASAELSHVFVRAIVQYIAPGFAVPHRPDHHVSVEPNSVTGRAFYCRLDVGT